MNGTAVAMGLTAITIALAAVIFVLQGISKHLGEISEALQHQPEPRRMTVGNAVLPEAVRGALVLTGMLTSATKAVIDARVDANDALTTQLALLNRITEVFGG